MCRSEMKPVLQMWLIIFPQVITALLLFHIMMIGLLAIKESFSAILVGFPPLSKFFFPYGPDMLQLGLCW